MEQATDRSLPVPHIGVTALANPFSLERTLHEIPQGWTVAQILDHLGVPRGSWDHTLVLFDGTEIRSEFWHCVRPKVGVRPVVRVVPAGSGSDFLRTLLIIGAGVTAYYAAPYAVGATLGWDAAASASTLAFAQAGIFAVEALAINALVPPSQPKFDNGTSTSPTLSVAAAQNALKPFGTMPLVLGKHRYYPPYAAKPYTELVGKDQYVRLLFVVGYKDLAITELKLGENDLDSYDDLEYQVLCGNSSTDVDQDGAAVSDITLFTSTVDESTLSTKLTGPGSPTEQTTGLDADEFSLDLTFPNGLIRIDKSGDKKAVSVTVTVEYKLATEGDGSYATVATIVTSAAAPETIRKGFRYALPSRDQYTVRITRTTDDGDTTAPDQTYQDDVYLTAFRTITNENPVNHSDAALIAIRIKATDQLNGTVSNFNCVASSVLPDYDSATGTWIDRETANPASLFRAVLEGVGNARPLISASTVTWLDGTPVTRVDGGNVLRDTVSNSIIDLPALETWHGECDTAGREFNMVRDFASTVWDTLKDVAAAGRGRPRHINGLWSVVRDLEQSTPKQHFTPRNSWGFSAAKNYLVMPHAFRVRFINAAEGWQNDERLVYDDGYDASNATRFETLELPGVTDSDQVWKEARYHIAVARLRPEVFTFQADVEHIAVTQGDMIRFSHDAILVGLGSARIQSLTDDGTYVTDLVLDDEMPMETGTNYSVRVRRSVDGSSEVHAVDTVAGYQSTLTLTTPVLIADAPDVGDLVMFGETGLESMDLIVDSIRPGADMSATLKCYSASTGIYSADTGTIPAFESYISQPPGAVKPVISNTVSDESVLVRGQDGTLQVRILVSFGFLNNREGVQYIELQYKLGTTDDWITLPLLQGDALSASIFDVTEGLGYDIRARYRFLDTTVGEWSSTVTHQVVGKTTAPPPVDTFLVQRQPDGTREFSWTMDSPPPDIAGFLIRYRLGTSGADWDTNMSDMLDNGSLVKTSPWETNQLAAGDYQIAIKAVDTGGRESANAKYISSSLGDPRIQNALITQDHYRLGWPGTKTDCHVESDTGYLAPDNQNTWADETQWSTWTAWNDNPVASMVYTTDVIDVGASVVYEPLVTAQADSGTITIEERHGETGTPDGTWSSWTAIGGAIKARYVQVRVTVTTPAVTGLESMFLILSANTIEDVISDLDTSTISVPTGAFNVPLTKTFSLITSVQMALQNVGAGWTWEVINKSTSGPLIKIYNGSGTLADATVDIVVKGL